MGRGLLCISHLAGSAASSGGSSHFNPLWPVSPHNLSHGSLPNPSTLQSHASCRGPLTCSQKQLLFPGLPSQGLRQMAAVQESSDTSLPIADMLGPLLTRQPHWVLPKSSLTAFSLQLCLELAHCGPKLERWGGTGQDLRKLGANHLNTMYTWPLFSHNSGRCWS